MTEGKQATKLPVDHINAELRKIGRPVHDAEISFGGYDGDEHLLLFTWPDGFSALVSMGPIASAMIERAAAGRNTLH